MAATNKPGQTVLAYVEHHAAQHPDQPFLITPDTKQEQSFSELAVSIKNIGDSLNQMGIEPGAKIAFLLGNGYWAVQLFLGVMANNRVIVPLNAVAGTAQLQHVLGHSDAQIVLVSSEHRDKLAEIMAGVEREITVIDVDPDNGPMWPVTKQTPLQSAPPAPENPALLLYTSGSTGLPKGAVLSHRAIVAGGQNVARGHHLDPTDRVLCVLPVYHINGAMVTVAAPLVSGSSVVMPGKFSARTFWDLVAAYQCTWSSVVPTIIKYLLDRASQEDYQFGQDTRLASFRFGRSASAPLPAVVLQQWEDTFQVPMIETIGLTETAGTVATNPMPPAPRKPGSVGLAFGNEIKVVAEDDSECGAEVPGEILIRGDNVLDEYYKNPQATQSGFSEGWFRTGDLGKKDADGYLYITGRLKELIIRGGENIAPREIDDVLYKHEAILEAAAVGVDDDNYGQEVVACVVVREGFTCSEDELKSFCSAAVGDYKTPKTIYFMDDLPKGPSGKILRLKLPEMISRIGH